MRKRYRYDAHSGRMIEVADDLPARAAGPMLLPDLDRVYNGGFRSPIDGEFITSRSQLRRHEIRHQVRQAGDFKPGELIAKEKARVQRQREHVSNMGVSFEWK